MPDFTAGMPAASVMSGMQKAWIESAAAAMKSFQSMAMPHAQSGKAVPFGEVMGLSGCQEAMKSAQQIGSAMIDANMKAFETYFGRFAGAWSQMGGLGAEHLEKAQSAPAKAFEATKHTFEAATKNTLEGFEKAQETGTKAWTELQKRLADGVKEWNQTASAWSQGADIPSSIKDSYQRLTSDTSGLFEVIQKTNTSALSLMQKRFSAAVEEMASHFPGKGTEKLEAASHAYEKAASSISDAFLRANKEAMEALQAWSTESMKAKEKASAGQKAA